MIPATERPYVFALPYHIQLSFVYMPISCADKLAALVPLQLVKGGEPIVITSGCGVHAKACNSV
jgi:hypothetical protein